MAALSNAHTVPVRAARFTRARRVRDDARHRCPECGDFTARPDPEGFCSDGCRGAFLDDAELFTMEARR